MQRALNSQVKKANRQHKLNRLHRLVAHHEPVLQTGACVATGFADIDAYLSAHAGGGLPCGGLHEVAAEHLRIWRRLWALRIVWRRAFCTMRQKMMCCFTAKPMPLAAMAVSPMARLWRRMVCPRKSWSISMALPCRIYYGPVSRR